MKITFVHSFYSSRTPSGENEAVLRQMAALSDAGHSVTLVARYTDTEEKRLLYPLRASLSVVGVGGDSPLPEIHASDPDVVHVHNLFPNWATGWVRKTSRPVVATLHNYRQVCANGLLLRDGQPCSSCLTAGSFQAVKHKCYRDSRLASLPLALATRGSGRASPILQHSTALITLNSTATRLFERLSPAHVEFIPNFSSSHPAGEGKGAYWLYVGRLTSEKGAAELIAHFPPNERLVLVGDGPLANDLKEAACKSTSSIQLLGSRSHEEVIDLMGNAAGVIVPSLCPEGIPTVALEALSVGTPVVISNRVAAASDLTIDGAGSVYDTDNPISLPGAMTEVLNRKTAASEAAITLHSSKYSERAWIEAVVDLYTRASR